MVNPANLTIKRASAHPPKGKVYKSSLFLLKIFSSGFPGSFQPAQSTT